MRLFKTFSDHVMNQFEGKLDNVIAFESMLDQAANRDYSQYTREEMQKAITKQFNAILGLQDYKTASAMERRQARRLHAPEVYSLVERVLVDRMTSGWNANNAFFQEYVEQINIADGDLNQFWVTDDSLLTVSKFAGNHHDVVRQALKPGKAFSIETSWYVIKVYADFELMMLGRIDFAEMVDRMYRSIEANRWDALFTAFMAVDQSLPTDMILQTAVSENTRQAIVEHCEFITSVTGQDVTLVGTKAALLKLENTVGYNIWSNEMKQERHENGMLGSWEGYDLLPLKRVNKAGTRINVFSQNDNNKILIMPKNSDKPIKLINEGDVAYYERGMAGELKDMTVDGEIQYQEGIGTVVNQLFGEILITS